jgi:excisionase family DNA binding protein
VQGRDELLSTSDAAAILGLSPDMVRKIAKAEGIRFKKTRSGIRLFRRGDVERLRRERQAQKNLKAPPAQETAV